MFYKFFIFLVNIGLSVSFAYAETTSTSPGSSRSAATTQAVQRSADVACPVDKNNPAVQCAIGFATGFANVAMLPWNLGVATLKQGRGIDECNRSPAMKRGILTVVNPLLSDERRQNLMAENCVSLLETVGLIERQTFAEIQRKRQLLEHGKRRLASYTEGSDRYQNFSQQLEAQQLTEQENAFLAAHRARSQVANQLQQAVTEQVWNETKQQWECLGFEESLKLACNLAGSAGAVGVARKAAQDVGGAVSSASHRRAQARNGSLTDEQRWLAARETVGRRLTTRERNAVIAAHNVGAARGATIGNYTQAEKVQKALILRRAGFSRAEAQKLLDQGVAGSIARPTEYAFSTAFENRRWSLRERVASAGRSPETTQAARAEYLRELDQAVNSVPKPHRREYLSNLFLGIRDYGLKPGRPGGRLSEEAARGARFELHAIIEYTRKNGIDVISPFDISTYGNFR